MFEEIILNYGYLGLFVISFLAATLLVFPSEILVAMMPGLGYNVWLVLIFASVGNFLGALVNYYVGKQGSRFVFSRFITIDPKKMERAQARFNRWGAPVLFFTWVPFVGDPLAVVGGVMEVDLRTFTVWVLSGKILRYVPILGLVSWLADWF